jgi:hypothetical protein
MDGQHIITDRQVAEWAQITAMVRRFNREEKLRVEEPEVLAIVLCLRRNRERSENGKGNTQ